MKVLLLSYHYPPARAVGGLRARRIAESFRRRGADVFVVAGPLETANGARETDARVLRVAPSVDLRALYLRLRARANGGHASGAASANGAKAGPEWTPPKRTPFLKRQISSALWLPDDRQGWILPAAARASDIVRREAVDLVYTSAPPFSVLLAGLLVKRRTGVPWALELRDPWTDNPWKPAFVRSAWSDAIERWLERRCLRKADHVVAVTDSVADLLRDRVLNGERVITVRNGIDRFEPPRQADHPIRSIIYVGNLYHDRDPRPFLAAIAALKRKGRLDADLRIDFIGDCRWLLGVSIERFVEDHGLGSTVRFTDPIPHEECLARMREADMLLLLAQQQPLQVPNKLYEYLGMRRRILAFADRDGETACMLRRVGGHCIIDSDDPTVIESAVARALDGELMPIAPESASVLNDWSWDRQFDLLHSRVGAAS